MSTAFREFLQQQAKKHQAEADAGRPICRCAHFYRTVVPSKFGNGSKSPTPRATSLSKESQEAVTEPGLGRYRPPRLNLRFFGKWIGIIPKARKTVGKAQPPQKSAPERAQGRVDITDELRRYVLYRFQNGSEDVWLIDGLEPGYEAVEKTWPGQVQYTPRAEPKVFDQEAVERALMSYLR